MSGQAEMEGPIITLEEMECFLQREYDGRLLVYNSLTDKMCDLEAKMPKPNPSSMLSTPGSGFNGNSQSVETVTKELSNFEGQYTQMGVELDEILSQLDEVRTLQDEVRTLQFKQEEISWLVPEIMVIAFVNHLERANQYFDFKDYLRGNNEIKPDSDCVRIADMLVMNEEVRKLFDKLDRGVIERAVDAIIRERAANDVCSQCAAYIKVLKDSNIGPGKNGEYPLVQYYEQLASTYGTLNLNDIEVMDRAAFLDPIFNLVYYTREKGHVMDEEPKMELQKIREFDGPYFVLHVEKKFPREEIKRIMSTYKDTPHEDVLAAIRTELYGHALERYHSFRKKYIKERTEDVEKPAKDEMMPENSRKRASLNKNDGESSSLQSLRRSVRIRTKE